MKTFRFTLHHGTQGSLTIRDDDCLWQWPDDNREPVILNKETGEKLIRTHVMDTLTGERKSLFASLEET